MTDQPKPDLPCIDCEDDQIDPRYVDDVAGHPEEDQPAGGDS